MFQTTSQSAKPVNSATIIPFVQRAGCAMKVWSDEDDFAVRLLYPDYGALQRHFSDRSLVAIKHRAAKLNVVARRHVWTQLEVARLRRLWGQRRVSDDQLRTTFPHLTLSQILAKASHIGLVRERPQPKHLGIPVLDAVRQRAHDEGLSMAELDRLAGTRRYFQQSNRRVVWRHVATAVDFLGGSLTPRWDQEGEAEESVHVKLAYAA